LPELTSANKGALKMNDQPSSGGIQARVMKWGMMACCAIMLVPVASFLLAGGTIAGSWNNAGVFAPIALCVGAHLVMHRLMGKSCHGKGSEQVKQAERERIVAVPAQARSTEMDRLRGA